MAHRPQTRAALKDAHQVPMLPVERNARMQISGLGSPSYSTFASAAPAAAPTRRFSFASVDGQSWIRVAADADALRSRVVDLRRMLERIDPNRYVGGASETRIEYGTASVEGATLGIDLIGTYATRRSTQRVNTDLTPFGPVDGDWQGATTATATVSGTYTGNTTETYTVVVDRVRPDQTRFDVFDSSGSRVRRITVDNDQYGQSFKLDEGLDATFQAGTYVQGDRFTFVAEPSAPIDHDPDAAFDVDGNLEDGESVSNGSFRVNGTEVTVAATDTLNEVLARITDQTDVDASFDAVNQHVILRNKTTGDLDVDLANDTSGFLNAFKLDKAKLERGGSADPDQAMRDVAALSGISSGTVSVNGVAISISRDESLNQALAAINASGAGVHAAITDGQVTLTSETAGQAISLDDGGTDFFLTLGLAEGTTEAPSTTVTVGSRRRPAGAFGATARDIAQATMDIGQHLAAILAADTEGTVLKAALSRIGSESRRVGALAFGAEGSPARFRAAGLTFDFRAEGSGLFDTSSEARRALSRSLGTDIRSFHSAMTDGIGSTSKSFLDELEAMATNLFTQARGSIDLRL